MLTKRQLLHFNTFGFVPLQGLFSKDEIEIFNDEFQIKLESTLRFTGPKDEPAQYSSWSNLTSETPHLAKLLEDPCLLSIAEQMLGDDCCIVSCNAGSYVNDTRWHPDSYNFHAHTIKFLIYLQSLDETNGALRLIPGSHKQPFHDAIIRFNPSGFDDEEPLKGDATKDIPAYICKLELGDVFIFDSHIWHASWGGNTDRRMLSPIYIKNPKTSEEADAIRELVKNIYEVRERLAKNTYAKRQPEYPLEWLANPDNDPRRQRWIDFLHKWGFIEIYQDEAIRN